MTENIGKIKDLFLRSGIPLEVSTISQLQTLGIEDRGEIKYVRDGKEFSTDMQGHMQFELTKKLKLLLNFSVECKYKEKHHKWIFMEYPESDWYSRNDSQNLVFSNVFEKSLEILEKKKLTDKNILYKFWSHNFFNFPTVNKGVDISGSQFESKTISEAISQSIFGAVQIYYDDLGFVADCLGDDDNDIPNMVVSLPVIVTTADIFKLKSNSSIEDIEESKMEDLLEKTPGVLYYDTNYSRLSGFVNDLIEKHPIQLEGSQKKFISQGDAFIRFYPPIHPGYVYIVNYYDLKDSFATCIDNMKTLIMDLNKKIIPL